MVNHDHLEEGGYAAGYIRVSSANQDVQRSAAAQKELIQGFVQEHGSGNIVWYVDIGNGIALPALKRLMTDARFPDRCFDQVLVYKMSRLSRNLADYQGIMSELRESGVTVVPVFESSVSSPTERLIESFIEAVNDHCREGSSQATRQGIAAARLRRQSF